MYYIYILHSKNADKYYVGYSIDPENRLLQHNSPIHNKFTAKYIPWEIVKTFAVGHDKSVALKVEKFIKNQKSRKFIEKLLVMNNIDFIIQKIIWLLTSPEASGRFKS